MIDEGALREKAREAIAANKLPNSDPVRIWGGTGFGACCAICGNPVSSDGMGFELEFAEGGDGASRGEYHIHVRCFGVWDLERKLLPASDGDGTIADRECRT
jgi:hypothetical protein